MIIKLNINGDKMNKKRKKKRTKRTPEQMKQLRKKQRKLMNKSIKKTKLREKERYDNITLEDLENHLMGCVESEHPIESQGIFPLSDCVGGFLKKFEEKSQMKLTNTYGGYSCFRNDNGLILLSDKRNKRNLDSDKHPLCGSTVILEWIVSNVDNRQEGWGKRMMNLITELSSKYDISIQLHCCDCSDWKKNEVMMKYIGNGMSTNQLRNWYKSFGFELDPFNTVEYVYSKNNIVKDCLIHVSNSIKNSVKFPSILGYNGRFNWDSTINCFEKVLLQPVQ
jgi:hypothetical protein|tara:strand:+ start:10 stop:849 length:840 start_codon:yes stop_codon:yes gene_type:complete